MTIPPRISLPRRRQKRLKLISASYAEVLDATKHQDDKIGQLLTGVAFLTAATLALAALEPISIVSRRFASEPFSLPLLLITLAVFLLGIAFGFMLLLISLSTPLRLQVWEDLGQTGQGGKEYVDKRHTRFTDLFL